MNGQLVTKASPASARRVPWSCRPGHLSRMGAARRAPIPNSQSTCGPGVSCSFHEAARSASAATVGRLRACGRKAGDCVRYGPHKELPAQGIARTRVVLSGRLARCQREAAREHISDLLRRCLPAIRGRATRLRTNGASVWQPESMWLRRSHDSACPSRPRAQPIRTRSRTPWPGFGHH